MGDPQGPVNILYFSDRASWYNFDKWPTWHTITFFTIRLFQYSTCFEEHRAHHQEV